jgi:predicted transcriptional regulator
VDRSAYYSEMKVLARATRAQFGLVTPRVTKSDLRAIYRTHGIRIDLWPHRLRDLRGAYFNDHLGSTVLLAKGLPEDPTVFTMAHELKHHLVDRELGLSYCTDRNADRVIEIGAEIFAAELIFPEDDFVAALQRAGMTAGGCKPEHLIELKRETRTTLSYAGLAKRATFLGFARVGALEGVRWKKLEEAVFGEPLYKRLRRRRQRVK